MIPYLPAVTTPPDADDVQETPEEPSAAAAWTPPDTGTAAAPPPPEPAPAPAPPPPGPAPAPAPRRTNRFAIVALLSGVFGLVVFAIGFAIATFVQAGRRGEKGKGLAAAGLAASAVWIAAVLVLATGVLEPGGDAPESKGGKPRVTALLAGDCFTGLQDDRTSVYATKTPCTQPHDGEIGAVITLADAPYPGDGALLIEATKECRDRAGFLLNSRYSDHLELHIDRPRRAAWDKGRHDVTCALRYTGSEKLTSTLASALQGNLQWTTTLQPGDCIKKWSAADKEPVVDCTEPHEAQLFAVFTIQADEYPGDKAIQKKVDEGCTARAKRLWKDKPPSRTTEPVSWGPTREGWESQGSRLAYCLVTGRGGPLKKSVVPH
ncbi:peptidyl-prolyl cis-trans isomerase [Actinomadura verrucosospora]|uniref:Peptidyl-prolyl cis-trans isomerase n=1 Tax=Actinomadura verrucosospora TaxID=46165 RepID=A0A7D3W4M5_ACTVE|nr:peptidyl-prolyl cis-trans isomerase [Actinomadura verrucosospora]